MPVPREQKCHQSHERTTNGICLIGSHRERNSSSHGDSPALYQLHFGVFANDPQMDDDLLNSTVPSMLDDAGRSGSEIREWANSSFKRSIMGKRFAIFTSF